MNKGMCVCFDTGYVLRDISDDERTASTVQPNTSAKYQQFLLKQELMRRRTSTCFSASL